jgi:hypothetical protein
LSLFGLAQSLYAVTRYRDLALRFLLPSPANEWIHSYMPPFSGLDSPTKFDQHAPQASMPPAPAKVWCPSTFCLYKGATLTQWHPATGYAAFSGFLNLSTLCSPLYLPGLFHPGSVFGVFPSGYYSLGGAVHAFTCRSPHKVELNEHPFQGLSHQRDPVFRANR